MKRQWNTRNTLRNSGYKYGKDYCSERVKGNCHQYFSALFHFVLSFFFFFLTLYAADPLCPRRSCTDNFFIQFLKRLVLKPGLARRVDSGSGRPGTVTGPGWQKKGKKKPGMIWRVDPVTRLTGQDPVTNPLTFVFFVFLLKRRRFEFF
jgi:hypothetical protein